MNNPNLQGSTTRIPADSGYSKKQILTPRQVVPVMRNQSGPDRNTSEWPWRACNGGQLSQTLDIRFFYSHQNQTGGERRSHRGQNNFPDRTIRFGWSLWTVLKVYSRTGSAEQLIFDMRTWRSVVIIPTEAVSISGELGIEH